MTAPASIYPTAVADLLPLAREWAQELGSAPSRNALMRRFHIGDGKANALLSALNSTAPTERIDTPPSPPVAARPPVATPEPESAAFASRSRGRVQPRVCLNNRNMCSTSKRRR